MLEFLAEFHFLRPVFLLGIIAAPFLFFALSRKTNTRDDWDQFIHPELLAHLRPSSVSNTASKYSLAIVIAYCLCMIAMSGPTWEKKPVPVVTKSNDLVVILDLSISMLSGDISPNRMTRAKQKLQDLLGQRREGNTALVVFSGDAHVVTPLTDDTNTIVANLPALTPFNMPVIGSRPDLAVELAQNLLVQATSASGQILLITDGVTNDQAKEISQKKGTTPLSVLAVGTENGAPIDLGDRGFLKQQGEVVIPKTDFAGLSKLANTEGGQFSALSLNDSDLKALGIIEFSDGKSDEPLSDSVLDPTFDSWDDSGYWLLVLAMPFLLLAHRRGAFAVIALLILPVDQTLAQSWGWKDLWQTKDQQAQDLLDEGRYEEAAALYDSPAHKLYAQAKSNKAPTELTNDNEFSTNDFYNQGTGLAKQGSLEQALEALNRSIELEPTNDDAIFNRDLVQQMIDQQSSEQQSGDQSDQQGSEEKQDSDGQSGENSQQNQQSSSEQQDQSQDSSQSQSNSDNESNQSQQDQSNANTGEQEAQDQQTASDEQEDDSQESENDQGQLDQTDDYQNKESNDRALAQESLSEEEKQSFEQWMRRVPDAPGGLLRRKFEYESRQRNRQTREEGDPLW